MNASAATRRRATALPAGQRREVLVEATLPLLLEHGTSVTTRQIAEAAGVAEGTIFRVFDDKDSLVAAVVDAAFDPTPFERGLAGIDLSLPLRERAEKAVTLLQERIMSIGRLMIAVGLTRPPGNDPSGRPSSPPTSIDALAAVLAPDADRLRRCPHDAAVLLRSFTLASTLKMLNAEPLSAAEVVDVLLCGIGDEAVCSDRPNRDQPNGEHSRRGESTPC